MALDNRNRFTGGDTTCKFFGNEEESLEHFILFCPAYQEIRNNHTLFTQPYKENYLGEILFVQENKEEIKWTIHELWKRRKTLKQEREQPSQEME